MSSTLPERRPPGAVMRKPDGNEVWIPCRGQRDAVFCRLEEGWQMVEDLRDPKDPTQYKRHK